jgi:autotransporter-associated beta strand protein
MADVFKANNTDALNLGSSWVGGVVPTSGDIAVWDSTVTTANTVSMGGSLDFGGIRIINPGGAVTINGSAGQVLTLGPGGIEASSGLTINSGPTITLILPSTPFNVASAVTVTLNCITTGTGYNWVKLGEGIASLRAANTGLTGTFTLVAGIVRVDNNSALGGAAASLALIGGTITALLAVARTITAAGDSTIGGNVTFGAVSGNTGQLTFNNNFDLGGPPRTLTTLSVAQFNGVISNGAGGIVKDGSSTLSLQNTANTFTGPVTVSAGTLSVASLANGGLPSSIGASSNDAANLTLTGSGLTYTGGSGAVTDRNFTISGIVTISASGTTPVVWSGSPTLQSATGTLTLAGTSGAGVINTFSGTLSNTGAFVLSLSRNSANTWKLDGTNTFTGVYTQSSTGITQIGNNGALGGATATMSLSGGTLSSDGGTARTLTNAGSSTIPGNITFGSATNNGALTFANAISLGGGARTLTIASPVTFTGVVSSGGMVKAGSSTLTLSGVGTNTYSTASTLSAGTLILSKNSALGSAAWTISAGTTLDASTALNITNALTIAGSFTFTGTANLTQSTGAITLSTATITVNGSILQFNGNVTGATAALTKNGTGQLTFAGTNTGWGTTSGDILVNAGTLRAAGTTSALGANTAGRNIIVASTATLSLGAVYTLSNIPLSIAGSGGANDAALLVGANCTFSSITLTAPATIRTSTAPSTITAPITLAGFAPTFLASASQTLTLPSVISDTGTATVTIGHAANTYTGTVSLTNAANTFSGQVRLYSGTLSASTLANAGANSSIGTGAAGSTIQLGSGTNSATFTYSSSTTPVSTDRAIQLMGTTGTARVNGGTAAGILTLTSNVIVTGVGNKTFTLGNLGVFAGVIVDGAGSVIALSSATSSTWTLAATNSYTGTTTVAGTLSIAGQSNISSAAIIGDGGALNYTGTSGTISNALTLTGSLRITLPTALSDVTFSGLVTGTQTLALGNITTTTGQTSILRLSNTGNTWSGGLNMNNGAVYITDAGQLGAGTKTISVAFNTTGSSGLVLDATSGSISLPSTFSFTTSNELSRGGVYNGIIAKGGAVTIAGTITMASVGGSSLFTADSGSTFTLAGAITANVVSRILVLEGDGAGIISGLIDNANVPAVQVKGGSGTWAFASTNLYAGGTTVSSSMTALATNVQGFGVGSLTISSATAKAQSATASGQNGKLTITGTLTNSAGGIIRIGG